ncbi:MAG: hypothetical protein MUO43_17090, partial [Desulfobacterales bacterium]|nr:hypothetical protein [Desulfobacterales bacterium]
MGKIFDALSKSEKKHIKLSSKNEENTALNEQPPKIAKPLNISGSLYNIDRNLVALIDPRSFEA